MSSERVTKSSVPNLPALLGAHAAPDPAPDTPVNLLVYPSEQRRKLGALCERYKIIPPYVLVGLENGDVPFIRMRSYMEIRAMFRDCAASLADRNMLAYKAFLLFGHAQRLQAFERNWGQSVKAGNLRQLINAIYFPEQQDWGRIDFRSWGDAFHQYGIHRTRISFRRGAAQMSPVRDKDGSVSLIRTKFALAARPFKSCMGQETLQQITDLSVKWNLNVNEYKRALDMYTQRMDPPNERHALPEFYIRGERFGLPGTAFYAVDRDDPVKMFIGNYTGCCERIVDQKNNIEGTIQHSYLRTGSTFYIVSDGTNILAHSWAWLGKDRALCLDGFESKKDSGFTADVMKNLLNQIATDILTPEYAEFGLEGLFIGQCARHLEPGRADYAEVDAEDLKPRSLAEIGMNKVSRNDKMSWVIKP